MGISRIGQGIGVPKKKKEEDEERERESVFGLQDRLMQAIFQD
jgi:hypothetical protein